MFLDALAIGLSCTVTKAWSHISSTAYNLPPRCSHAESRDVTMLLTLLTLKIDDVVEKDRNYVIQRSGNLTGMCVELHCSVAGSSRAGHTKD